MDEQRLREAYQRTLARRAPADRAGCPDPEALRALASRQGPEPERLETLDHIMGCAACRREFDLLRAVLEGAEAAGEGGGTTAAPAWSRRFLAVAAVVVVLIGGSLLGRQLFTDALGPEVMRGEVARIDPIAPAEGATVAPPVRLSWEAVPGVGSYSVEVIDLDGAVVFESSVRDSFVVLPSDAPIESGTELQWSVRAAGPEGELRSPLRRFRIEAP